MEAIELKYADVLPLHPVPICEICGDAVQIHRFRESEIWFCPGEEGQERHLLRRDERRDPSSVRRTIEYSVERFLETFRRPAFGNYWPFAPSPTSRLGDECLNPDPQLLDTHHARLLATIAVIDGAGLAADDDDLGALKQQCHDTLEAVEALQADGSAFNVLEPAVAGGTAPSEIQQWLLIETVILGADAPPKVRFTLDRPDVHERIELADLRQAIAAAREWADQREGELRARENRQL
ncbi:hypothetical protein ABZ540_36555 [Nocardia xishanensis]|uniref:hypothetical protein n=1 Tax=Nocardia xishanensis TaxID=238964 RepID=UPI003400C0E2